MKAMAVQDQVPRFVLKVHNAVYRVYSQRLIYCADRPEKRRH